MGILRIGSGDFADVFDMWDGSVVKAFRRLQQAGGDVEWCDEDALTRELCEAEARAYEGLRHFPDLAIFAPQFFGRFDPCGLVDVTTSPEETYVKDCGLRLERICGEDIKVARLDPPRREEVRKILEQIEEAVKPGNVWDSSCFIPGSRAPFACIDFAVWDNLEECAEILRRQGQFTEQQREQLRLQHRICD